MRAGVSIGAKTSRPATNASANAGSSPPDTSATTNPATAKTPASKAASKPVSPAASEPDAPKDTRPPRRVVTFRFERFSGKGSSTNAALAALKKVKWVDPDDIEVDLTKREIRVGQLEESKEYAPAEKSLKDAGFTLAPGVTSGLRKR